MLIQLILKRKNFFLPKNLPQIWLKFQEDFDEGPDSAFYTLLGHYMEKYDKMYDRRYNKEGMGYKIENIWSKMEDDDSIWDLIDNKYGKHVIEW